jgi:hypothetical protein
MSAAMMPTTMSDRTTTGNQPESDRPTDRTATETMPAAEAARRLGITPDAVRARINRGTLAGEKRGAQWWVYLPTDRIPVEPPTGTQPDATGTRPDTDRPLVEQLRSEVDYLRGELAARNRDLATERERSATERERADVLMREALGRIEALTAGETREDATQSTQDGPHDEQSGDAADNAPASWWRRWWRSLTVGP